MKPTILFDESQCANGKTTRLNKKAANDLQIAGKSTLIIKPSIKAIKDSLEDFKTLGVPAASCVGVYGSEDKTDESPLLGDILTVLDRDDPTILLITRVSFKNLASSNPRLYKNWSLVMDEVVDVYEHNCEVFVANKEEAISVVEKMFDKTSVESFYKITAKPNISDNDAFNKLFGGIVKKAKSDFFDTYMHYCDGDNGFVINFHSVLNTKIISCFDNSFLYASHGETSLQHHIWSHTATFKVMGGREFKPHEGKVEIHCPNMNSFSKSFDENNKKVKNDFIDIFYNHVGCSKTFIYLDNNKTNFTHPLPENKVPHNTAGQNCFQDKDTVGLFSSLNPRSYESNFISQMYGISQPKQVQIRHADTFYQTIMRGILRLSENHGKTMHVYCMSRQVAKWLGEYFTECTIIEHDVYSPVKKEKIKKEKLSPENRNKAYMIKKVHNIGKVKTKDLMNTKLWNACSCRGLIQKPYSGDDVQTLLATTGDINNA